MTDWFGMVPDFIITINAAWWLQASDVEACALVEHELYHCAQDSDEYWAPKFNKQTGRPVFTIRGHDVEEYIGVVRRYGADAAGSLSPVSTPTTDKVMVGAGKLT